MTEPKPNPSMRSTWPVGLRVSRKDSEERGTVVEHDGEIKIRWDDGRTSYFRHGHDANVALKEVK